MADMLSARPRHFGPQEPPILTIGIYPQLAVILQHDAGSPLIREIDFADAYAIGGQILEPSADMGDLGVGEYNRQRRPPRPGPHIGKMRRIASRQAALVGRFVRSEEHTSELQPLMR